MSLPWGQVEKLLSLKNFSAVFGSKLDITFTIPCHIYETVRVIGLYAFYPPFDTCVLLPDRTLIVSKGVFLSVFSSNKKNPLPKGVEGLGSEATGYFFAPQAHL